MLEKVNTTMEALQNIEMRATIGNMELMLAALYNLRDIRDELMKEVKPDEGSPEQRDGD